MSRWVVIVTIVIMGLVGSGTALALTGSGTEQDPWRIQSLDDFNDFAADANYWAGFTRLETDVNLAGMVYDRAVIAPDVNSLEIGFLGTAFTGVFDGNEHKIINLTIDDGGAGNDYLGLFGNIDNGEVRNLGLEGGSVSGDGAVGGLVGMFWDVTVTISNCYYTGDVNGDDSVGGLVGISRVGGNILNCYSTGGVSGDWAVGGLVGFSKGFVTSCYSTSDVSGESGVGGLVGYSEGSFSNCFSTGDVNGVDFIGGLVGEHWEGIILNCYSTGDVNGVEYAGGFVGFWFEGPIENSFWDIETSGQDSSDGGTGLPTAEMHQQSTFTDWDFINVWNIGENQTYPYLRVYLTGDINKDGIVNFLDLSITANQWMQEQ